MGKTKTAIVSGEPESKADEKKKKKQRKSLKEEKGVRMPGLKGGERVVAVGAESSPEEEEEKKTEKIEKKPKVRSKKYQDARAKIDKTKSYPLNEAIKLVKETSYSSFNGSVELHIVTKKQGTSANVTLPHSTGKEKKIEIAKETTVKKLEKGKVDFDVLLATPDMMPKLVPFAKILGPKGLMPNPKNGTIIKSVSETKKFSVDKINLKTEKKAPLIHIAVGKVNANQKELEENIEAVLNGVGKRQIVRAYLTSTMGPSAKLQI